MCHTPVRQGPISVRLKMSFHGEKIEFVCERSAAGNVHESLLFFVCVTCLRPPFFPSLQSASPQDQSICIRPLKEFSDSCLLLFSLSGYDCNSRQAPRKGSKIHLSLSTQSLVTADGWCPNPLFLLMGLPEGCVRA